MANKKNTKTLQRTKQYNNRSAGTRASSPNIRTPNDSRNYGGFDYRDAIGITKLAANHPAETLGFTLGSYIGNYLDRDYNKRMDAEGDRVYDGVLAQLGGYGEPSAQDLIKRTYGFNDPNQDAQDYLQSGINVNSVPNYLGSSEPTISAFKQLENANGMQDAANAGVDTQMQAQQAVDDGQPVTGAGASAMGLNPKDAMKSTLYAYKMNDFIVNGENPSQARRDLNKIDNRLDKMSRENLLGASMSQIEDMIDKELDGTKISYNAKKEQKQRILDRIRQQRDAQAQQYATQLYIPSLTMNPDDYQKKYAGVLQQFAMQNPEYGPLLAPSLAVIKDNINNKQKLELEKQKMWINAETANAIAEKYPNLYMKGNKMNTVSPSSGSSGGGTKSSSKKAEKDPAYEFYKRQKDIVKRYEGVAKEGSPEWSVLNKAKQHVLKYEQDEQAAARANELLQKDMDDWDNFVEYITYLRDELYWSPEQIMEDGIYQNANQDYRDGVDDLINRRG